MPRTRVIDIQEQFSGLNTTASEDQLGPTEVRQAANVKFTAYGAAARRNGTQRVHTTALTAGAPIQGGYFWDSMGLHIVVCLGTLYSAPWGTFPLTWTQIGTANFFSLTNKISFQAFTSAAASGAEVLYIADGGKVSVTNAAGTAVARLSTAGTPTAITYLAVQNKRLFGVDGTTSTLYWSSLANGDDIGVPGTPSAGGNDVIKTFGESALQSLLPMAAGLVILHKRGTSTFTGWGQNDISISSGTAGISADIGTLAPFGNVTVENNAFVFSDRGIYQLTPYGLYEQISKPIESVLNGLSHAIFPQIVAAHDKVQRQVYFMIPTLGVYCWNYRTNGWSGPWNGIYAQTSPTNVSCTALWSGVDQNNTPIVVGGFSDGFVRQTEVPNTYLDDILANGTGGQVYFFALQSRRLLTQDPYSLKLVRWIYATVGNSMPGSEAVIGPGVIQWSVTPTFGTGQFIGLPNGSFPASAPGTTPWRIQGAGHGPFVTIFVYDNTSNAAYYSKLGAEGYDYGRSRYAFGPGVSSQPTGLISGGGN